MLNFEKINSLISENEFDELFDNKILKLVILSVLSIPFFISIYHNKSIYNYINSKDNLVKKNFDDDKFMYTYLNLNIGLKILLFILIAALFMLKPNNDE